MDDDIKKAESRGYSKGYNSGRRKRAQDRKVENERRVNQAIMDRLYLVVLPVALTAEGWTMGGKKVVTGADRVRLANAWAREAYARRPRA